MNGSVRHLYVHLPFCASRCGYCDFVTAVGRRSLHGAYVDALLAELDLERGLLAPRLESVFLGGGTPTFTQPAPLARLLAALPAADEVTVEANPETVTREVAALLREGGVTRVSLGAQTFQPDLLATLERRASPDDVRRSLYHLRDAGFDNISLDLIYGIPGQTAAALDDDLSQAIALAPEHLSCYELEAKPGTRFTHQHGAELGRQHEAMDGYFEHVVERLTAAGYRWYETANFCRRSGLGDDRDLRSRHNLAYWRGRDYLGLGVGAVSTLRLVRRTNRPRLAPYLEADAADVLPPAADEPLTPRIRVAERLMLGLRLAEGVEREAVEPVLDPEAAAGLERLGLLDEAGGRMVLTRRGRLVANDVVARLLRDDDE